MSADAAPVVHQVQTDTGVQIFSAVGSRLSGGVRGMASGDVLSESAIWVQTMAGRTDMDDTSKAKGYDADSYGFAFGGEAKVFEVAKVGVGFATTTPTLTVFCARLTWTATRPSSTANTSLQLVCQRHHVLHLADYEETKSVLGTSVRADYDVETFGIQAMTGYEIKLAQFFVTPEVGMRYFHISQDSYTDTAGMKVANTSEDVLTGVIGARIGTAFEATPTMTIRPEFSLAMTYDVVQADNNSFVTLANGASYTVNGETLDNFGIEAALPLLPKSATTLKCL